MRYLVAVLLCLTMGVGFGQNLTYIPDSNGDGFIGVSDLQDFLATYANEFIPENLLVGQ
jgi:hypothetical protein